MARTQISFASFNLLNLNLAGERIYFSDGWTQEEYNKKIFWSAANIRQINAHVWGFQELWNKSALEEVFRVANLENDYDILVPPNHNGKSIVCGGAVKKGLLIETPEWITNFPDDFKLQSSGDDLQTPDIAIEIDKFSRPVLKFKIHPRAESLPISVFVVHLKSKRPTNLSKEAWFTNVHKKHNTGLGAAISTIRRSAEAAALRMLLVEELKNSDNPVVVLGDLNDGQLSNTLNILTGQPRYLMGLSSGGTDAGLYTVGSLQDYRSLRGVYYTHVYQDIKESLDHILVSQEFYDNSRKRVWAFKGMTVVNDHLNDDNHKEIGTSDHGIVKAAFEYRPAKNVV